METVGPTIDRFGNVHKTIHGDGRDIVSRIVRTCEEMLRDRGCDRIVRASDVFGTIDEGSEWIVSGRGGGADVDVYVHNEDRVGVKFARSVLEISAERECAAIIVSIDGATPFTRKECEGRGIQFMVARDLCTNITRHALVPKHERVESGPEGTTVEELPRILDTDRVVQYYNWPPGTVLRIWRHFGGHEPTPYFRVVTATGGNS